MSNVNNITEQQKGEIIQLINMAAIELRSDTAVATKCNVSPATINLLKSNTYPAKGDDMWIKVGRALGWRPIGWQIATDTTNVRIGVETIKEAHRNSLFIPIAEKAGAGKSTSIQVYRNSNIGNANVFSTSCRDWSKREFFDNAALSLGISMGNGYKSLDSKLDKVIEFFKLRPGRPLWMIDQANSLKPSVLSFLIHVYNELEDQMGVVISGTEHLQIDIKRGVKYSKKGYDELDSRFGRNYIHLIGNTLSDTRKICNVNGVEDKAHQEKIFEECYPIVKNIGMGDKKQSIQVIEDTRRIKRAIQKHHLLTALKS